MCRVLFLLKCPLLLFPSVLIANISHYDVLTLNNARHLFLFLPTLFVCFSDCFQQISCRYSSPLLVISSSRLSYFCLLVFFSRLLFLVNVVPLFLLSVSWLFPCLVSFSLVVVTLLPLAGHSTQDNKNVGNQQLAG